MAAQANPQNLTLAYPIPLDIAIERPDWAADVAELEALQVGVGGAGGIDLDDRLGDWLEIGAEVTARFDDE